MHPTVTWKRITFNSTQHLKLTGMLADAASGTTIVHIHGTHGNYFSAGYISILAAACVKSGINLFTINTSGHDGISEAYRGEDYTYVGGALSDFAEVVADIEGAINFARTFSEKIVLAGHSLGCDRIVFHAQQTGTQYPLVLISPCDSRKLHEQFLSNESVEDHIDRLKKMAPRDKFELLPSHEFGIHSKSERYLIPIARDALLSIIDGPPFKLFRLDQPAEFRLSNPSLICIGGRDKLQTAAPSEMFAYMSDHFSLCSQFLADVGDHEFSGAEHDLAGNIVSWAVMA
jgi:hypothetical protein